MASANELVHFTNRIREDLSRSQLSVTEVEALERLRSAVDEATTADVALPEATRAELVSRYGEPPSG